MNRLFRLPNAKPHNIEVIDWLALHDGALGDIARYWFGVIRQCGEDVRVLLHDDQPTACVDDAAFAYVDVFKAHVNLGFFQGADLVDPKGLLQGSGKFMRHVKLRPDSEVDKEALMALIQAAYVDVKARLRVSAAHP